MSSPTSVQKQDLVAPHELTNRHLELQSMRNWYLLSTVCAISTVGLVVSMSSTIQNGLADFFPWASTGQVLMVGLVGMIFILILHLTYHQLRVRKMRFEFRQMESESHERERKSSSRLAALMNVTRLMGAFSDPEKLITGITGTCLEIFDCQQVSLMLLNRDTQMLEMKSACGHDNLEEVMQVQQPVGKGIAGHVAETMVPIILSDDNDEGSYRGFELKATNLSAAMVAPIVVRDELVGVLNIASRVEGTVYTDHDLEALLVFAENVGTCIRQSERSEWMRQTIERQQRQLHPDR
jgi:transcriptional regulator with GAF, ATPase, and Fis domain